jgi:hypothetical protein
MRRALLPLVLFAIVLALGGPARAASAFVSVSGPPLVLDDTGFLFDGGLIPLELGPGEMQHFTFDYEISVHDDGRPAPFDPAVLGCLPLSVTVCAPAHAGHDFAQAIFDVAYRDGRAANRFIDLASDAPTRVQLATGADSFADHLTQSGTIHLSFINTSPFAQRDVFLVFASAWVLSPIPEPATVLQLLAGLAVLAALVRLRAGERYAEEPSARL